MEKHLFLTGPTGSGKSTILRRALGTRLGQAGGFVTEAAYGGYGELVGFVLLPAAAAAGVPGFVPETFLDCSRFPPHTDNEVYRGTGVRLLQEAAWYPYVLLDEFGGFELIIPQFRTALTELLHSGQPILGALKTAEEADAMRRALGLGDKYLGYSRQLRGFLAEDRDTRIVSVSGPEDAAAITAVTDWIREFLP